LPAFEKEFGARFSASNTDPFKPLCDRIAATEILAELIGAGTGGVEAKSAEAPAATAEAPSATNESQRVGLTSDGDREAKPLPEQKPKPTQFGKLIVDKGAREVRWNNHRLKINRKAEFSVLALLWDRVGNFVSHEDLFYAIDPDKKPAEQKYKTKMMTEAAPAVKTAIQHIRAALRAMNAGDPIETQKSLGYMLRSRDE
jgi:DNA-binding winged helix-turn-helix (wHTH) protein